MIIQLEIPKEFAKDYTNNRFDDFFRRVYADIDNEGMCGNYEGETAQMMARAFKESRCLDYENQKHKRKRHPERQRADGWSRVPGAGAGSK